MIMPSTSLFPQKKLQHEISRSLGSPTWSSLVSSLAIDRAVGLIYNLGPDLTGLCSLD